LGCEVASWRLIVTSVLAATASSAALAEGPGKYAISGTNVRDKSEYHGIATLTQIGPMTWQVVEEVGNDTFEGFGVGDGKTIAVSFTDRQCGGRGALHSGAGWKLRRDVGRRG